MSSNTTIIIIIGNAELKYPTFPLYQYIYLHCSNWKEQIHENQTLILDKDVSLDGIKQYLEGAEKGMIEINKENCFSIKEISKISGDLETFQKAEKFINENVKTVYQMANELIQETNKDIIKNLEISLSEQYNELLKCPNVLDKIKVEQHHRILEMALKFYGKEKFDYNGFLLFCVNLFQNNGDRRYSSLFTLFDPSDFDIDGYSKLLNCPNFDKSYSNLKSSNFITTIKQIQNNQDELINSINELKKQNDEIINQQKSNFDDLRNQFKIFQNEMKEIKQNSEQIIKNQQLNSTKIIESNDQNSNKINSEFKTQIQLLNESLKSHLNLHNTIKQNTEQIIQNQQVNSSKIIESNKQYSTEINSDFSKQIQLLNKSLELQQTKADEIKENTKQIIDNQLENLTKLMNLNNQNTTKITSDFKVLNESFKPHFNELNKNAKQIIDNQQENLAKIIDLNTKETQLFQNHIQTQSSEMTNLSKIQQLTKNEIVQIKDQIAKLKKTIEEEEMKAQANKNTNSGQKDKIIESLNIMNKKIDDTYLFNKLHINKNFENEPFSGIFQELTKQYHDNINDKGIIKISGNINGNPTYGSFRSLVDFNCNDYAYLSSEDPNSYLCFDFNNYSIIVTAYSLKSTKHPEPDFIQSWIVEGSNDKNKWIIIDSHTNDQILCSPSKVHTFCIDVKDQIKQPSKFVRIRITGKSSRGKGHLEIANVEFFGQLYKF